MKIQIELPRAVLQRLLDEGFRLAVVARALPTVELTEREVLIVEVGNAVAREMLKEVDDGDKRTSDYTKIS